MAFIEYLNDKQLSCTLYRKFYSKQTSDFLFSQLSKEVQWEQKHINYYGRKTPIPRLTAWYGDKKYSYSGIENIPHPFAGAVLAIKKDIDDLHIDTNSCLLNYYRNGNDSIDWHSDNEPELGQNPTIVSLSLGQTRVFQMRKILDKTLKHNIILESGDLLVMEKQTQHFWEHSVQKQKSMKLSRINLTFRNIHDKK